MKEKEKKGAQREPLKKFDLRSEGHKGNWESRILDCGLRNNISENMAQFIGFWRKDFEHSRRDHRGPFSEDL